MSSLPAARSPWLVAPAFDLPLVILTPLLTFPLLWLWRQQSGEAAVYALVMSFGALGHHLPGMLRAYGDRALFQRFRTRFLLAPLFLLVVCAGFAVAGLHAVAALALLWGIWHGWMQTYGFARIYDGKRGAADPRTARIDFLLCAVFFASAVVISPYRSFQLLDLFARCGMPVPPAVVMQTLRGVAVAAIAVVVLAYVGQSIRNARAGGPASLQKHLLLASSCAAWWIATNHVPSLIFGLALFEVFHDVQYLAIVWAFNRQRARKGGDCGIVTRWLFRGGVVSVAVYLGLVLAYGAMGPLLERAGEGGLRDGLAGVLLASQLLHFYFDGFLWKVRERATGDALGIGGGGEIARRPGLRHALLWGLFVVPVAVLGVRQWLEGTDQVAAARAVAGVLPDSVEAQGRLGLLLAQQGRPVEAVVPLRAALAARPEDGERRADLARTLAEAAEVELGAGRGEAARQFLREALVLEGRLPELLAGLVAMRADGGDGPGALRACDLLELAAPGADARLLRVRVLAMAGRLDEAAALVRAVRAAEPARPDAAALQQEIEAARSRR